ncbi:MAG: methionine adenosyltransferase [Thermoplasmata archaeon]|nr:methionine adenosyltransferase [Thermoplasmata archaeon]
MARNILINRSELLPIEQQEFEIVERKGLGHPDSIADGIAESVSRALCKMYLERYGRILHHNTDECEVVGGQSAPKFGGGVILEPVYILLVGRATTEVNGERLPYRTVAIKAAAEYLKKVCRHLDVEADITFDCRIGKGSVDLRAVYDTQRQLANDTSFGVGFAPLSETEKITLEIERYMNGKLKRTMPEIGEDIKVMSYRQGDKINVTVAVAMVDSEIPNKEHYINTIGELREVLKKYAARFTKREVNIAVNTADNYEENIFYLTVTGLSMENGDDGSVGRGNRANGLITPCRFMSLEASAGKNPVTHVGKLYNLLATDIAKEIVKANQDTVADAYVRILSQIGKPIDEPQIATVSLVMKDPKKFASAEKDARAIAEEKLKNISSMTEKIYRGEYTVF